MKHKLKIAIETIVGYLSPILSDRFYIKIKYWLYLDKWPNLRNPQTFSEKIQWLKLYDRKPIYSTMVDKYKAKKYVASIIGDEYIIPTIGVWDNPKDIDFDTLPDRFVLKCNHNSGKGMCICKNKAELDFNKARKELCEGLKENYYLKCREWPYKNVKRRVIAEQYMEDHNNKDLKDYKFFCFDGKPIYCQVISDRSSLMSIDFYDASWNHQPFHEPRVYPFSKNPQTIPVNYQKMLELAAVLSKGFRFLRVDFYEINNKIYFGELTFYPTSGLGGFDPNEYDNLFGDLIKLN